MEANTLVLILKIAGTALTAAGTVCGIVKSEKVEGTINLPKVDFKKLDFRKKK